MTRFHATPDGNVAFTAEEETARDAEEQAWADGADARAMADVRAKRDALLASTDWTGNSDVTMSDAMTAYRQALRDLPANTSDANNITWPTLGD